MYMWTVLLKRVKRHFTSKKILITANIHHFLISDEEAAYFSRVEIAGKLNSFCRFSANLYIHVDFTNPNKMVSSAGTKLQLV